MIEVTRSLMVRRSEVSGTPRDGFSRSAVRSRGSPSSPKVRENRRHSSPRSAPGGGSVTRCTRSGGSEEPHRSRMSGISCTAQNHEPMRESRAGSRMVRRNLAYVMWLRCLTFSCHSAGIWRTRSRTDSTRCTSASPREASARSTCVGVARAKISWLTIEVPCQSRTSAASRSQAPTASVSMPPHGSVIRSSAARKWASNRSAG